MWEEQHGLNVVTPKFLDCSFKAGGESRQAVSAPAQPTELLCNEAQFASEKSIRVKLPNVSGCPSTFRQSDEESLLNEVAKCQGECDSTPRIYYSALKS